MVENRCRGPPRDYAHEIPYVNMHMLRTFEAAYRDSRAEIEALEEAGIAIEESENPLVLPPPREAAEETMITLSEPEISEALKQEMVANRSRLYQEARPLAEILEGKNEASRYVLHNPAKVMFGHILHLLAQSGSGYDLAPPGSELYAEIARTAAAARLCEDVAMTPSTEDIKLMNDFLPYRHEGERLSVVPVASIHASPVGDVHLSELSHHVRYSGSLGPGHDDIVQAAFIDPCSSEVEAPGFTEYEDAVVRRFPGR